MQNPTNGTALAAVRPACAPSPGAATAEAPRVPTSDPLATYSTFPVPGTYGPPMPIGGATPPAPPPIPGECSPRIDRLAAALVEARRAIRPIAKGSTNAHLGNRYADLAEIRQEVLAACLPLGLWIRQVPEPAPEGYPATWRLRTTILHAGSGQWISSTMPMLIGPGTNPMQAFASAETYASRYALRDEFCLVIGGEDDDANGAGFADAKARPAQAQPPRPAPRDDRRAGPAARRPNPSHGKALFKWAREQEERGRKGVVNQLRGFFEQRGYKGRMVDLTEGDLLEFKGGLGELYPELFGDDAADAEGGAA